MKGTPGIPGLASKIDEIKLNKHQATPVNQIYWAKIKLDIFERSFHPNIWVARKSRYSDRASIQNIWLNMKVRYSGRASTENIGPSVKSYEPTFLHKTSARAIPKSF